MTLFNRFEKKDSHAICFKKFYEKRDMNKMQTILLEWLDNGKHDALFGLAMVILVATRRDKTLGEATAIFKSSVEQESGNAELFEWYKRTALRLLDNWAGEETGSRPEIKEKSDESKGSDINFNELSCKEFSMVFKDLYDELADAENDEIADCLININKLLDAWQDKCPDDANFPCAYVMIHEHELSEAEKEEYVYKHIFGKKYDESLYEWYQNRMARAIKASYPID